MKKTLSAFLIVSGFFLCAPFQTHASTTYATWNPSDKGPNLTLSNGNLTVSKSTPAGWTSIRSTINKTSGKWYWEYTVDSISGGVTSGVGTAGATTTGNVGDDADGWGYNTDAGGGHGKYNGSGGINYGIAYNHPGDVVGVALDMDNGSITMYVNGASQGTMFSNISGTIYAMLGLYTSGDSVTANFGASPFAYSVPSGYNAGLYTVNTNCNSSSSPATCSDMPTGSVAMATSSQTLIVNTTAVTADSQIFVIEDSSLGSRLGITCDTASGRIYSISARTPGTSFTIKSSATPSTAQPACLSYMIVN